MIFKTFNNDLDGISNKIGFSKRSFAEWITQIKISFSEGEHVLQKFKNALTMAFTSKKNMDWKTTPSGEIVSKRNIDSYLKALDEPAANALLKDLQKIQADVDAGTTSWNDYFKACEGGKKYLIDFIQKTDLQKASIDDLINANKAAREAAIAHNNALKQQALGAKAATIATKVLSIALNTLAMIAIGEAISALISGIDSLIHKEERETEALEDAQDKFSQTTEEIKNLNDELTATKSRISELQELTDNGTISLAEEKELNTLKKTNEELERKIALKQKEQADDAKEVLEKAQKKVDKKSQYSYIQYTDEEEPAAVVTKGNAISRLQDKLTSYQNMVSHGDNTEDMINAEAFDEAVSKDAKIVGKLADAYKSLTEAGIALTTEQQAEYNAATKAQDAYLLYSYTLAQTKERFQGLTEEQQRSVIYNKLLEKGLTKEESASVLNHIQKDDLENYYDFDFNFPLPNPRDYEIAEEYGKAYAEAWKNGVNNITQNTKVTFEESWNSLDTTENTSLQNLKEDLLSLAKHGMLTVKEFNKTTGAKSWLNQIGISAEEAIDKINNLKEVSSAEQLASMKTGISSISSILRKKKENLSDTKTANIGIGVDTLGSMPDDIKSCTREYETFCEVLGNGSSTMAECRKASNKLAAAYINNNNFLSQLTDNNKDYFISVLNEMGIQNSEQIVLDALNKKKAETILQTMDFTNKTGEEIVKLLEQQGALNGTTKALELFALKKIYANGNGLNTTNDINQMIALVKCLGYSTQAIETYNQAKNSAFKPTSSKQEVFDNVTDILNGKKPVISFIKDKIEYTEQAKPNASSYIESLIKQMENTKISPKIAPPGNGSPTNNKSNNYKAQKPKETKQIIDWLERRFKRMQDIIDLTAAKLQNLFSIKAKSKNLDNQIKQTTKLIRQYSVAISKYKAKAKAVSKGLSKDIKNKVTSGKVTKESYSKLVKAYGQEKATKIQNYIDWYDKWQKAKHSKKEQKANKRNLKKEKNQLYVDRADSKLSMLDAQVETALNSKGEKSAKAINKILQKKVNWTKQYYDYQIKNAKLEKDSAKIAELQAQKKKALLDIKIEKRQNLANEAEAYYNLYQQYETNAVSAKEKNKYEKESLSYLKTQYNKLIKIAELEGDITEQKRLQAEKQEKIAESYQKMYNNIKTEYENQTGLNDAQISTVQARIATLEAAGKVAAKEMYHSMMKLSSDTTEKLLKERTELKKAGKNFEYGSQEWYNWQNDLLSIDQQLEACTQQSIEFQKAINELDLKKFSLIAAQIESANNQIEFLTSLLSHKDLTSKAAGGLTDEGFTTISLWIDKMENNKKIIENAQNAMAEYTKQIAEGTAGDDFETQNQKLQEYTKTIQDAKLADEELKDSIVDLVEEAFHIQLDILNELIEKRKKALQTEKDLYDYQRKVTSQAKTIAGIQKQIAALTGDNSEEARAKLQKLKVSLEEAQQDLKDTEYDKWLSDQEDILDSLANEMEDFFENIMHDTNGLIAAATKAVNENGAVIVSTLESLGAGDSHSFDTKDNGDGTSTTYYTDYNGNQMQITSDRYGNVIKDTNKSDSLLSSIESTKDIRSSSERNSHSINWNPLSTAAKEHIADRTNASTRKINQEENANMYLKEIRKSQIAGSLNKRKSLKNQSTSFINKYTFGEYGNVLNQYLANKDGKVYTSWADMKELADILGIKISGKKVTSKEAMQIRDALKDAGFAKGGVVSALNNAVMQNGDDGLATLRRGESVLTPEQTAQFSKFLGITPTVNNMVKQMAKIPQSPEINSTLTKSQNVNVGGVTIHLDGSGIVDEQSFIDTFKRSTMIQSAIDESVAKGVTKAYSNTFGRF